MTDCSAHRAYLGAVADGETQLVPQATVDHLETCLDCNREVSAHSLLNNKLRRGLARQSAAEPSIDAPRRSWPKTAAAAVAVFVVVAGAVGAWRAVSGEDRVVAAAAVAGEAPQFRSTDSARIGTWCQQASRRSMADIRLDSLQPTGARMDHRAGTDIVTVQYRTAQGDQVDVAWLDATHTASNRARIEARSVGGRFVLLVTSPSGTAVVSGLAPATLLWQAAAAIERTDGGSQTEAVGAAA